LERLLKITS